MEVTMKKAVLDRIVDGKFAVLLVGDEETEEIVPISQLPAQIKEGTWLTITDGQFVIDQEETMNKKDAAKSKLELLRKRGGSKFKNKK